MTSLDPRDLADLEALANVGEIVGPVTHEFNNLLNTLLLQIAVLEQTAPNGLRQELAGLKQHGKAAAALIRQVQQYRRHLIEAAKPTTDAQRLEALLGAGAAPQTLQRVAEEAARNDRALAAAMKNAPQRAQLEAAFRAYAAGNLNVAEQLLASAQTAEAMLLRGCVRATRGLLARDSQAIDAASDDFRGAKRLDPKAWLDPHVFSPKLVELFDRAQ